MTSIVTINTRPMEGKAVLVEVISKFNGGATVRTHTFKQGDGGAEFALYYGVTLNVAEVPLA